MTLEDYPDDAEIVKQNFKTDQQADAAEKIEEEWPVDLDRLAEEGQHVKMFYKQVLDQFLGPAEAGATFAELKDEHGSLEQWAESDADGDDGDEATADDSDDVAIPDVDDIEPGTTDEDRQSVEASVDLDGGGDVDDRRRAWFRAGFREGVEFAVENPELFRQD